MNTSQLLDLNILSLTTSKEALSTTLNLRGHNPQIPQTLSLMHENLRKTWIQSRKQFTTVKGAKLRSDWSRDTCANRLLLMLARSCRSFKKDLRLMF